MSKGKKKAKPTDDDKRVQKLEKVARDKDRPKKERKAAQAELDAIRGVFVPTVATGGSMAELSSPPAAADTPADSPADSAPATTEWRAKQDAEVARQWAHFRANEQKTLADPTGIAADLIIEDPAEDSYRLEGPIPAERILVGDDGVIRFRRPPRGQGLPIQDAPAPRLVGPDDGPDPLAVSPGDAVDAMGRPAQEAREVQTDHGREFAVGTPEAVDRDLLDKPADPVLTNGNGQPIITYVDPLTGREKTKGYTRVTTYIKGLEDTSVLERWKMRTLLEGGAVELLQNDGTSPSLESVARQVRRLDDELADIDRREKVEGELLGLRRAELLKTHKDTLDRMAEELLELGGAHEKANKGTDLHRLTELVDSGLTLPESTTASDRRDVEAYLEAKERLGLHVLWTEKRVVLDDIQVSGTMDRAYLVKLPGMSRRVRVVGDLKTGRVDWGAGKIGMQLALYARGQGYDWTKPTERERLSLSQHTGLLVHLPQGEGVCQVYVVDLELASRGLALAREVREWRNAGKRVFDLKKPLGAEEAAA